jgi:hypothetical protein
MTIRRGFNRLFVVAFVWWNLTNVWLIFSKAHEAAVKANDAAEWTRQFCINFKKSGCPASDPGFTVENQLENGHYILTPYPDTEKCSVYWSLQLPSNIDCEAILKKAVVEQTAWRKFKEQITAAKLLCIEGIPAAVYMVCWAVAATFIWVARGFGMAGRRGGGTKLT